MSKNYSYDKYILTTLIDSYENSLLFTGENKVNIHIHFPINKKTLPVYFDESSLAHESIHACVEDMVNRDFLKAIWQKGKEGHILTKVILNTESLTEIYRYLRRKPKELLIKQYQELLEQAKKEYNTPICAEFISYLLKRLNENQSVKEYLDITDIKGNKQLLHALYLIECNEIPCYVREFSIRFFSDSKVFEGMLGKLTKIIRTFGSAFGNSLTTTEEKNTVRTYLKKWETSDILAEYNIFHTPNYVYFKGKIDLYLKGKLISIGQLHQGIGLSGEDIRHIRFQDCVSIRTVITIENLTTFFRWQEKNSLILYLGGYLNKERRSLIQTIYQHIPDAKYYHFGDIDVGGFEIFRDLCVRTGVPFALYHMDVETLKEYGKYGRKLTDHDRKRISHILESQKPTYAHVLQYMLQYDIKLEQECVRQNHYTYVPQKY